MSAAINHPLEVAALLYRAWGEHRLSCELRQRLGKWEVVHHHFTGPYDSHSGEDCWEVDAEAAFFLIDLCVVVGQPHWGYTSTTEYHMTDQGAKWLWSALTPKEEQK